MSKKIMFNERYGLQQATFDGTKTMTRRTVPDNIMKDALAYQSHHIDDEKAYEKYILDHAPYKLGFDFVGCEIDKGYYEAQEKRFQEECKDTVILPNGKQVKQLSIEL